MTHDELWIGDKVILLKSLRLATYEGSAADGRARVKLQNGKMILTPLSNLKEYKEKIVRKIQLPEVKQPATFADTVLDLHIERLAPHLLHAAPQIILNKQISTCKAFVEDAIHRRKLEVTIIHGVGTGALRMEIEHLLKAYDRVGGSSLTNNGGATTVRFIY